MNDALGPDSRPSKRVRLDECATSSISIPTQTPPHAPAPPAASSQAKDPIPVNTTAIDNDLEREIRAGITEYVCPDNLGFTGILKQRYTDFMVNEIGLDGVVVHLKDARLGSEIKSEKKGTADEEQKRKVFVKEAKSITVKEGNRDAEMKDAEAAPDNVPNNGMKIEVDSEKFAEKEHQEDNGEKILKIEKVEEISENDVEALHSIFGEATSSQIILLVKSIRRREHKKAKDFKPVIAPPIADKEIRTQAHRSLRRIFPNLLESSMEADQSIRIKPVPPQERKGKKKGRGGERDARHGQLAWEEHGGEYLHFTLYKENKDTMEVIGFLGSQLKSGSKAFGFAGTKDRRACTVQRVCVKRQTAERMSGFNRTLFNAAIGDCEYRKNTLELGDLLGNEFNITLRDCHFQSEEGLDFEQRIELANYVVSKAIKDFSKKGFINYYGLQRFGSFSASTDTVGLKMLQGDLEGAVEDLLAYNNVALAAAKNAESGNSSVLVSQDDRNRAKALHIWKTTGKGGAALDLLPRRFTAERNIIQHLSSRNSKTGKHDRKSDWQGALMSIPRNLRLMYVHAYQSLVWNIVAGKRWSTHGDQLVEGDLVLVNEHKDKVPNEQEVQKEDIDQDGEMVINPTGDDSALKDEDMFERARPLTKAEAESGKYSIFDIVLPQPGFDVEYPKNHIGKFYEEFMGSERGGGLDPHNMRRSWREISLSGGYRKFLARPLQPLDFSVHQYIRDDEQFVETDLQRVKREKGINENGKVQEKSEEMQERKVAVVLKLQLGSSQYATVALRELMKAGGVKAFKPEFMGGR